MTKKSLSIIIAILAVIVAVLAILYIFSSGFLSGNSPEKNATSFYDQWVAYEGSPLAGQFYRDHNLVSTDFADRIDTLVSSFEGGAYDPFLCAQDIPSDFEFKTAIIDGNYAQVPLLEKFSGGDKEILVMMKKEKGIWVIDNVDCDWSSDKVADDFPSQEEQEKIVDFIKTNISQLSEKEAVLGGTWYVTEIVFLDASSALVSYEDGHIASQALASFTIDTNGRIAIDSFVGPEDDNQVSADFRQSGNLVNREGDWQLVYEKPGQPALTVSLNFFDSCLFYKDGQEVSSCLDIMWSQGDRVLVEGFLSDQSVMVSYMYYESPQKPVSICVDSCGNGTCEEIVCLAQDCPCPESAATCPADCQ